MGFGENYRPRTDHQSLGDAFFTKVEAAKFPKTLMRFRNERWSKALGLDRLTDTDWESHFGRFTPLPNNLPQPLALKYHGHQFHHYNPDLGDGRGFLFAQLEEPTTGRLLDFGTKGSGRTPFSRGGDGRLTLKGGVREILASSYLEALGVNTSKGFSLIETDEALHRGDEPSPTRSAVLVRLGHSHIRFGTFQRLAAEQDTDSMMKLVLYCLKTYYADDIQSQDLKSMSNLDVAGLLLSKVTQRTAKLVAQWFAAGFVHGVLNTDNMNIAGESFDYGPFRVLPTFEPGLTAAYFDSNGLYAFGRQPEAVAWNIERLAEALLTVGPANPEPVAQTETRGKFTQAMSCFGDVFQAELIALLLKKLWIMPSGDTETDVKLIRALLAHMQHAKVDFEGFFFDIAKLSNPSDIGLIDTATSPHWTEFSDLYSSYTRVERSEAAKAYFNREKPVTLLYDDIENLWAKIDQHDDWTDFQAKCDDIDLLRQAFA
ncbi:MAG: protein adenylyltransferase SelO family protein [Alphaproteobacteria bacterium]